MGSDTQHVVRLPIGASRRFAALSDSILCAFCEKPIDPRERKRGCVRQYCGKKCRTDAADLRRGHQRRLPFEPTTTVLRRIGVPDHNPDLAKKLKRSARQILARLEQGPATRLELQDVGGNRYAARIAELRDAGNRILGPMTCPRHSIFEREPLGPGGIEVYRLERE